MQLIRKLSFFCFVFGALTSCSNIGSSTSNQISTDKEILSKLDRIEKSFDKGDANTACDLQLKLSKDLLNYERISPEILKSVKEFQLKCGSRSFSIDFGKVK